MKIAREIVNIIRETDTKDVCTSEIPLAYIFVRLRKAQGLMSEAMFL